MTDFSTVTVLCSANVRGQLARLPRLFTIIQQECRASNGPVFLLDLGDTCTAESWVCRATQGRAPLLVLDSMGYDAVLIGGPERVPIPPSSLRQLAGQLVMPVIIWNRPRTLTKHGATFTVVPGNAAQPQDQPALRVDRATCDLPAAGETCPVFGDVPQDTLLRVDLDWPDWSVQAARLIPVLDTTPADPTITAVVELVENEARWYGQQGGEVP